MKIKGTLFIFLCMCITIPVFSGENLLKNPGFETISNEKPSNWSTWEYNKSGTEYILETGDAREGNTYATIINTSENDARLTQRVKVKTNKIYKLSCWIKTENIGTRFLGANISILDFFYTSRGITGTRPEWTYEEFYIRIGPKVKQVFVSFGIGGYANTNTGRASFDDLRMEEVNATPEGTNVAYISPRETEQKDTGRNQSSSTPGTIMPVIFTILIIILAGGLIGTGIFFAIRFGLHKKLPDSFINYFSDWVAETFPPPPPELGGIKRIVSLPYVKAALILILIISVGLPFFLDISESIKNEPWPGNENHYVHLAKALLEGRIDIPYKLHDIAIYNGKYYVIYPPFPVLLVLPFVALFGLKTKVTIIGIALALISCILLYRILMKVQVDKKHRPWILLAFFLGTGYWLCLRNSMGVAWFAHVVSVFAVLLAIHEALGRGNGILTGLFLGFAFLSRQLTLFFALFFVVALWTHGKRSTLKKKLFHAGGFLGALGICVLIYLAYNYIRFGNIFDTGYTYLQLGGFMRTRTQKYGQFSIFHIPFNFVYMFLQGFHINYGDWPDWFTSVHEYWPTDPFGTAITFASPFVFYAVWARWKKSLLVSAWISIAVICLGTLMYYNNGWVQYNTQRFSLDFFPLLIVIIALGIQKGKKPFWKGLILFSVLMNTLTMLIIPPAG